jgi:ubiquitin C-terminal hydrolase
VKLSQDCMAKSETDIHSPDAHAKFMEAGKLGSPPVDRKETGAPVGLRNLGATCYVSLYPCPLSAAD